LSTFFFLIDLVVNFRTGHIEPHSGRLDLSPTAAASRYLRTWFVPDLLAAALPMDLLAVIVLTIDASSMDNRLQSLRTLRIIRLPKCLRVLRILQLRGVEVDLLIPPSTVTMAKVVFFALLFWHWSGLLWWVMGGEAKADDEFGPPPYLANATLFHRYCSSIYWTIAVSAKVRDPLPLGGGYTMEQTVFCNAVVVCGLLIQAMLVGSASSVVQSLDSQKAEYNRRLSRIKSYLNYKGVPPSLQRRVMFYYKFMWTSMGSLDDANPLPKLPAPLKAQMDIVLTRKIFVSIPVFHSCKPDELLQMVQGLVPYLALPGDVLIDEGSISLGLFFIMRGTVVVVRRLLDSRPDGATLASPNTRAPPTATPDAPAECPATMHRSVTLAKFGALSSAVSTAARAGVAALHVGQTGPTANEEVLHELSEGFFGEETVIYGRAASSTVRAVRHSDFFLLPMAVFDRVVEGNAEMRQKVMEYAEGRSEKSLARKVKMASAAIACRRAPRQRRVVSAAAMLSRARSADKEKGKAVRDAVVAMSQKLSAGASTNARDVTTTRRDRVHPGTPTDSQ